MAQCSNKAVAASGAFNIPIFILVSSSVFHALSLIIDQCHTSSCELGHILDYLRLLNPLNLNVQHAFVRKFGQVQDVIASGVIQLGLWCIQ